MATTIFGAAIARGQASDVGPTEAVTFQSENYTDFRQVFAREASTAVVRISATLRFPEEAKKRYPAVVIVHTIAGYLPSNEGWHAAEFRKAGFATLTYDSFAARGLSEDAIIGAEGGPPWASAVADAHGALRLLVSHPKIDADRVAIVGFSFGGEVAHLTAFERLRSVLGSGQRRFAAHVAYYPAGVYGAVAEPGAYTGAPILLLLGGKDDNLPVAKVADYLTYASAAGHAAPIDLVIYPGAYHAWTVSSLARRVSTRSTGVRENARSFYWRQAGRRCSSTVRRSRLIRAFCQHAAVKVEGIPWPTTPRFVTTPPSMPWRSCIGTWGLERSLIRAA